MNHKNYEVIAANITDSNQAPKGKYLFYRCKRCGEVLPSLPKDNVRCDCGNVCIDIDYLRLLINDYSLFEAVRLAKIRR